MRAADHLVDFGPGPGVKGGEVVAAGTISTLAAAPASLTGQYLSGRKSIAVPKDRRAASRQAAHGRRRAPEQPQEHRRLDPARPLRLRDGRQRLGQELAGERHPPRGPRPRPQRRRHRARRPRPDRRGRSPRQGDRHRPVADRPHAPLEPGDLHQALRRDPRPLHEAPRLQGPRLQGRPVQLQRHWRRCEACQGNGSNRLEMDFLADVWVTCPVCEGKRFNRETLHVRFKGKSISDVLEMDVQEALEHFANVPKISGNAPDPARRRARLPQARPALADPLRRRGAADQARPGARPQGARARRSTSSTSRPPACTSRTSASCSKSSTVSPQLGNTVVVIEHNLDVVKTADWVIDLGPEGGAGGGLVVAEGTPEQVAATPGSHTGEALRRVLDGPRPVARTARARQGQGEGAASRRKRGWRRSPSGARGSTTSRGSTSTSPGTR